MCELTQHNLTEKTFCTDTDFEGGEDAEEMQKVGRFLFAPARPSK
jgi:hypothetical protein